MSSKPTLNKLQRQSLYGSHMPILARVMDLTDGPVLEIGMGIYSTPLLDIMCRERKRPLTSIDNDQEWWLPNSEWASDYHRVCFTDDWDGDLFKGLMNQHWSVALVDEKPAKHRKESIKQLAWKANFVIIHDSEPEVDKYFKYSWIYQLFKYRYDYTACRPNTTVLSNFIDLGKLL